jgi:hypothetical protein
MIVEHLRNVVPEYSGMNEGDKKVSFDKPVFKVIGK